MEFFRIEPLGELAKLCLGTTSVGSKMGEHDSFSVLDRYCELGGNFIDTARVYSFVDGQARAEQIIGKWRKSSPYAKNTVIATKGAHPPFEDRHHGRLSREEISYDLDCSLVNLKTDCIDLYYLHRDDESREIYDIAESMESFRKEGKIRAYGCSNWKWQRIEAFNAYCREKGYMGFAISQISWSAAKEAPSYRGDDTLVRMDDGQYDYYLKTQMPVAAYSSSAKGLFSKADAGASILERPRYASQINTERWKAIKELSLKYNVPVSSVVLSYITSNPLNSCAIIGYSRIEQVEDSMRAGSLKLSATDIASISKID